MCSNDVLNNEDLVRLLNVSLKNFSEYVRGLPDYDANKVVSHLMGLIILKFKESKLIDIGHFLGTLSLLGLDPVYLYLERSKNILETKIDQANLEEITEFILKIYRVNRLAAKLVVSEIIDQIFKRVRMDSVATKYDLLRIGRFVSTISKLNCKWGFEIISSLEDIICNSIKEIVRRDHALEYTGAFLYSIALHCPDNAKYVSQICEERITDLFDHYLDKADFEELGLFFGGLAASNKALARQIWEKNKERIYSFIKQRIEIEDISNVRVLLKGLSLYDKDKAMEFYTLVKEEIIRKAENSPDEKIKRFYEALRTVNIELAEKFLRDIEMVHSIKQ